MKNLIIIIGTIILGALIVSNFVLAKDGTSLYTSAKSVVESGTSAISGSAESIFSQYKAS